MDRRPVINFVQALSLVMALIMVALVSAILTMHFAIHGAEVQVPALKGMTVADARSQTAGLGLNLDVDNRYYSADVAAGHILTQSPPEGTIVRRAWLVRVSESLGPQKVEVPDTVGRTEREAALTLRRVGLEVGTTAHLPDANAAEGAVLAQDPPAHAQGIAQPSINLLVAVPDETPPDGFVMPDLIGLPVITAQAALFRVGIKTALPTVLPVAIPPVGTGIAPPRLPIRPGSVVSQQPAPGSRVDQTTLVKLDIAQ